MITGMDHVGISVSDLDRSLAFYCDVLGMDLIVLKQFDGEDYARLLDIEGVSGRVAVLKGHRRAIELFQFDYPEPRVSDPHRPVCDHGITHFCLAVEDIDAEYRRLKAAGVRFHGPPVDFAGKAKVLYARDPDGNVFELLERTTAP